MDVYKVLNRYLNPNIRQALNNRELLDTAEEIRIRQNKPLVIKKGDENFFMKIFWTKFVLAKWHQGWENVKNHPYNL